MERSPLQAKDLGNFPGLTAGYFGSCTSALALGTHFPFRDSYGYLCQSKHAPRTTADAPGSEILVRNAGWRTSSERAVAT